MLRGKFPRCTLLSVVDGQYFMVCFHANAQSTTLFNINVEVLFDADGHFMKWNLEGQNEKNKANADIGGEERQLLDGTIILSMGEPFQGSVGNPL